MRDLDYFQLAGFGVWVKKREREVGFQIQAGARWRVFEGLGCGNREVYYGGIRNHSFLYQRDCWEAADLTEDVGHSVEDVDDGDEYESSSSAEEEEFQKDELWVRKRTSAWWSINIRSSCSVQSQAYVLMKYWNKRTQQEHTQFQNVPIGKVKTKFLKLRKQLKRKQKETTLRVKKNYQCVFTYCDCSAFATHRIQVIIILIRITLL